MRKTKSLHQEKELPKSIENYTKIFYDDQEHETEQENEENENESSIDVQKQRHE